MQLNETQSDGLKKEFKIVIPNTEFETAVDDKLKEIAKTANIKGFRPGKVPMSIIKQKYRQGVLGEVLQQTVQDSARKVLQEKSIRPAMEPKIEITEFNDNTDLEFTLGVELMPEFEVGNLGSLTLEKLKSEVTEDGINEAIERISEAEKRFEKISDIRAAKKGDAVLIDFKGEIDGTSPEGLSAEDFELELGSDSFIPGFEDQVICINPKEERTIEVKFPETYQHKEMAGKDAIFKVTAKEIRSRVTSSIDDEMAKRHGFEDLKALRTGVNERLKQELEQASQARLKRILLDELASLYDFEVPPGMVEQEFDQIWKQVKSDVEKDGRSFKEVTGETEEEASKEYREIATRRVRLGLVLSEIGQQNNITVSQQELAQAAMASASQMASPEQIAEFYRANPKALERFQAPVYEDKEVAIIIELATVSERKVTQEELFSDPDENAAKEKLNKNTTKAKKTKKKTAQPKTKGKPKTSSKPNVKKNTKSAIEANKNSSKPTSKKSKSNKTKTKTESKI